MSLPSDPQPRSQQPRNSSSDKNLPWRLFVVLGMALTGLLLWQIHAEAPPRPVVDYSTFYGWLENGKVATVVIKGAAALEVTLKAPEAVQGSATKVFRCFRPDDDDALLPLMRSQRVQIRVTTDEQPFFVQALLGALPWLIVIAGGLWLSRRAQKLVTGGPLPNVLTSQVRKFEKNASVNVTFDDVAGLKSAKQDLLEVVKFLKHPERFQRLGGKVPRGVLLVGPPGTGKTLLARAVAGESGVPFFSINGSEFIEMFVGVGAARVRDLFAEAKKSAPAIVFIDEIDAVGRSRGAGLGGGHDEREQTLNQLLSEMDGFERNDLTIVLAATNRPDVLDPALLRPGRFDRRVVVDRPELTARRAILDVHVGKKPLGQDVDLDGLARNTPGFSGADLANLVNEAALNATRRGAASIDGIDFSSAYDKIVLGDLREAKLLGAEKRRVAVHESGHAVVARFSPDTEALQRVSILPRGLALGSTQQQPGEDQHLMTQPQLESRLRVLMGGYAAESLVLGNVSTGAENDLKEATKLASKMVANYGMSHALGPVYYEHEAEHPFLGQRIATDGGVSDATLRHIESEARRVLTAALAAATQVLSEHKPKLSALEQALLERETLERLDLDALLA